MAYDEEAAMLGLYAGRKKNVVKARYSLEDRKKGQRGYPSPIRLLAVILL